MHVMMVLTGKMKTDKNFLYPKRCCERVCQSWAIAPIRWSGDQGEGGFNNVSDETSTTNVVVAQLSARCGRTPCTRS